jgi:outer membrane protein TolC
VAKAAVLIAEKDLFISDSIYVAIKQKFDEGLTDASAVNQALINKNAIQQNILQSNQLLNQAVANIKILAGLPAKTDIAFGEVAIEKEAEKEDKNLGEDKTLLPYKTSIDISLLQQKEQKAAFLPKLSATGYFGFQEYRDRFEMSFAKNAWSDYQYIGLGLNWPLFTGFANSNKLKSSGIQKKIAEQNYEAAKEQSTTNDFLLIQNLYSFRELVFSSKSSFELYGKNLELSRQKFKEGLISIDVYLKTFQDYLTAENVYLNNLSNLLTTKASIEARNSD